jgi:hypothetical protein
MEAEAEIAIPTDIMSCGRSRRLVHHAEHGACAAPPFPGEERRAAQAFPVSNAGRKQESAAYVFVEKGRQG